MDAVEMLKRDAARITLAFRRSPLRASLCYHFQSALAARTRHDVEQALEKADSLVDHFLHRR